MKHLNKRGAIGIGTVLYVVGGAATFIFIGMSYVQTQIQSAVTPVQAQTELNTTQIASISTNIEWIREALTARGFSPNSTSSR
jgi:predicted PurR-regulated permease PerM